MARLLTIAVILVVFTQVAVAGVDPRPDVLGVYFDEGGYLSCNDAVVPFTPFFVWIVYTNPTPAQILGFEAGFYLSGSLTEVAIFWPCDLVWVLPPELDDLYVTCAEPFPTSEATPLVRFEYVHLDTGVPEVTFHLEKASGSSLPGDDPYIILADGSPFEVRAGGSAYTTWSCALAVEPTDWGTIKSLYR